MVADNFKPLDFVRGKKSKPNTKAHLEVSKMHQKEQEELILANESLSTKNEVYKLQLQTQLQENKNLIDELKLKRKEITSSNLDLTNKKEQYSLISDKQKEARVIIKELQSEIKNLRATKTTIKTEQKNLDEKLALKASATIKANLKRNSDGKIVVTDTKQLKKDIIDNLKEVSNFDYKSTKETQLQSKLDTKDTKINDLGNQLNTSLEVLTKAKDKIDDLTTSSIELEQNNTKVNKELKDANIGIEIRDLALGQLQEDIKDFEKIYKFDYDTFKESRKSLFQIAKEEKMARGMSSNKDIKTCRGYKSKKTGVSFRSGAISLESDLVSSSLDFEDNDDIEIDEEIGIGGL
jgi:chromosome segregation ATPase